MIFFLIQERGGSNTEPPLKLKMSMPPFFDKKKKNYGFEYKSWAQPSLP